MARLAARSAISFAHPGNSRRIARRSPERALRLLSSASVSRHAKVELLQQSSSNASSPM